MTRKEEYLLRRRRKKITHEEIAKVLDCSQSLISKYETGYAEMSHEKVNKYQEYIDKK